MRVPWKGLWALAAVGVVGTAGVYRGRVRALEVLDGQGIDDDDAALAGWAWLTAPGVEVDKATRIATCRYAAAEGLDALDLVPGDLPVDRALEFLRDFDPKARGDRLAAGLTARQALVVRDSVLERARISPSTELDEVAFVRVARELKQYCPTTMDLVMVPDLQTAPEDLSRRRGLWSMKMGRFAPLAVELPAAGYVLLAVGLVLAPYWGLTALLAWCANPLIALAGTRLRPPDLVRRSLLRWLYGPSDLVRVARGKWRPSPDATGVPEAESLRSDYEAAVADGTERFFEARRDDCPLCESPDLSVKITTPDLFQGKPGTFELDQCGSCGLVFQNPRLSLEGLDYYYRDLYDGLGGQEFGWLVGSSRKAYGERAAMLKGRDIPRRWLDVGAGQAHFCLVARETWPDTVFDGLDMSENIETAERKGWVTTGYRGKFVEIAGQLANSYDVVSMHHYLEHTREPLREFDAALTALRPGGYLLIELPDPEFRFEQRFLGHYWASWFQPQHLNMLPIGRLIAELERRGMQIVEVQRGRPHIANHFTAGVWFFIGRLAPRPGLPWRPESGLAARARRGAVLAAGAPFLLGGLTLDGLLAPVIRRGQRSNTYRLLAQAATGPGE